MKTSGKNRFPDTKVVQTFLKVFKVVMWKQIKIKVSRYKRCFNVSEEFLKLLFWVSDRKQASHWGGEVFNAFF